MKKIISAVLSLILTISLLTACTTSNSDSNDLTTLTLNEVTHSIFYAPQYVAISQGYFAEEGIQVELVNGGGADNVMTAVLTGAADIGLAGAEASIYVHLQGKENPPKVVAQLTACDGSFLISRQDTDFNYDELIGKTLLPGRKGGMPYMTLLYVLNQNGLVVGEDVFFNDTIDFTAMVGAFTAGEGDYVTAFEPTASTLEKEGKGYVVASIGADGGTVPYTVYFPREGLEDTVVEGFVNAITKGQQFVADNSSADIAVAIQDFFPETSLEDIAVVIDNYKAIGAYSQSPAMSQEDFYRIVEIMKNAGEVPADTQITYENIIDDRFVR